MRSLKGERLCFSSPQYLGTIRRGSAFALFGLLGWILLRVAEQTLSTFAAYPYDQWDDSPWGAEVFVLTGAALLVALFGWWRLTTPDAAIADLEPRLSLRRILRILTIAAAVVTLISRVAYFSHDATYPTYVLFVWLPHVVVAALFLHGMGARIPAPEPQYLAIATLVITGVFLLPCLPLMFFAFLWGAVIINSLLLLTILMFRLALVRVVRPPWP